MIRISTYKHIALTFIPTMEFLLLGRFTAKERSNSHDLVFKEKITLCCALVISRIAD